MATAVPMLFERLGRSRHRAGVDRVSGAPFTLQGTDALRPRPAREEPMPHAP